MNDSSFSEKPSFAGILFPGSDEMRHPVFTVKWEMRKEGAGSGDAAESLAKGEKCFDGSGALQDYLNFPPIFYKHGRIDKNYL